MRTLRQLDPAALFDGVLLAIVVVGAAAGLSILFVDRNAGDGGGGLSLLFFAVIIVGFGLGGHRVARHDIPLPITHGAFVGLITFAAVQAVVLTLSAVAGREGRISIASLAFSALIASSAGMIGASLGVRRATWHR